MELKIRENKTYQKNTGSASGILKGAEALCVTTFESLVLECDGFCIE
jgi:hypothetical protein